MPSPIETGGKATWLTRTALLAAFGLVMFLFESALPRPLPWAKPGLANIATLLALYALGPGSAWSVTLIRVLVGSLVLGTFFSPGFWLSLAGGISASAAMILARRHAARWLSLIGVSLIGALAHVLAQIALAGILIVQRVEILYLLPLMLWPALFAGFVVGVAAWLLLERIRLS
jgi:heptaprenyl diphosphate synthase